MLPSCRVIASARNIPISPAFSTSNQQGSQLLPASQDTDDDATQTCDDSRPEMDESLVKNWGFPPAEMYIKTIWSADKMSWTLEMPSKITSWSVFAFAFGVQIYQTGPPPKDYISLFFVFTLQAALETMEIFPPDLRYLTSRSSSYLWCWLTGSGEGFGCVKQKNRWTLEQWKKTLVG